MKKVICFVCILALLVTSGAVLLLQAEEPAAPQSAVEAENKDYTLENGVESSMDYGVGSDTAASGEKYQGMMSGYSFVYKNVVKANQVTLCYASALPLTVSFSYQIGDGDWQALGSILLSPTEGWSNYQEQSVLFFTSIPEGSNVKVDSDADGSTKGANMDSYLFSVAVPRTSIEAEDKNEALENGSPSSMTWFCGDDAAASGGKYQGAAVNYSYIYYNVAKGNTISVTYASTIPLTIRFSYCAGNGEWQEAGRGELSATGGWSAYQTQEVSLYAPIPDGAALKVDSDADGVTKGANLDRFSFRTVSPRSSVEAEEKDAALENGSAADRAYGVASDEAASGGRYQGANVHYSFLYSNIVRSNTITVRYASALPLTVHFSYRTDGEWQEAGSGVLTATNGWSDYAEQKITLSSVIPEGAEVKVDTDADGQTKGANLDRFDFSFVDKDEDNPNSGDGPAAGLLMMLLAAVTVLPVLRKKVTG